MFVQFSDLDFGKTYSEAQYSTRDFDHRVEFIDGKVYQMMPGTGSQHQDIAGDTFNQLKNFFRHKPCNVFVSPFDVKLPEGARMMKVSLRCCNRTFIGVI